MPQPTSSDVHIDAALTNISVAYMQDESSYIADKVFPFVPVEHKSDKYYIYRKGDWFRDDSKPRAAGAESAGGGYNLDTDGYLAEVYAFHKDVDEQVRANADPGIDPEVSATNFVTQTLLIGRERNFANTYFKTGVWGTDVTGVTGAAGAGQFVKWSDDANGDPITDISNAIAVVLQTTGFKPNTLTVGYNVHTALKKHPLVVDRYKYTSADSITPEMLAALFEIKTYLISEAVYNSAKEGQGAAMGFALGNHALLTYRPPAPSLMVPSAGYTFGWRGLTGLNNMGVRMLNIPAPLLKVDRIEGEMSYALKMVASDLGYFFSGAV